MKPLFKTYLEKDGITGIILLGLRPEPILRGSHNQLTHDLIEEIIYDYFSLVSL